MYTTLLAILSSTLTLTAILNPPSKVLFMAGYNPPFTPEQTRSISLRTNLFCLIFLFVIAAVGQILFQYVFKLHIDAVRVAGGVIVFLLGINMVRDVAQPKAGTQSVSDIAIVPLGIPLTAGAGTIVVVTTMSGISPPIVTYSAVTISIGINYVLMRLSGRIGAFLMRFNLIQPVYRLTGLIVVAMGSDMVLSGIFNWLRLTLVEAFQTLNKAA